MVDYKYGDCLWSASLGKFISVYADGTYAQLTPISAEELIWDLRDEHISNDPDVVFGNSISYHVDILEECDLYGMDKVRELLDGDGAKHLLNLSSFDYQGDLDPIKKAIATFDKCARLDAELSGIEYNGKCSAWFEILISAEENSLYEQEFLDTVDESKETAHVRYDNDAAKFEIFRESKSVYLSPDNYETFWALSHGSVSLEEVRATLEYEVEKAESAAITLALRGSSDTEKTTRGFDANDIAKQEYLESSVSDCDHLSTIEKMAAFTYDSLDRGHILGLHESVDSRNNEYTRNEGVPSGVLMPLVKNYIKGDAGCIEEIRKYEERDSKEGESLDDMLEQVSEVAEVDGSLDERGVTNEER